MEYLPPMITNGMQIVTIYGCPLLAVGVSWIGGARTVRKLAGAGGVGGAIGGVGLFIFERLTIPVPWWDNAMHLVGMGLTGGLLGALVAVVGFLFRRRLEL